jgi:hypothetical protein
MGVPPGSVSGIDLANYRADATVIAQRGSGGCGWGRDAGTTRQGVFWRVVIEDNWLFRMAK